jgi:hypothetical protein
VSAGGANVIASSAAVHAGLRPIGFFEFAVAGIPMLQFSIGSVAILSTLTLIGTALLMTHFLNCLAVSPSGAAQECPAGLVPLWPAVALGAILLPWLFYPVVGDVSDASKLGKILDGLWPVAIDVGLGLGLRRIGGLCPSCRPAMASSLARPRSTAS